MKEILELEKAKNCQERHYYVKGWVGKIIHEAVSRACSRRPVEKIPPPAEFRQLVRDEWENIENFDTGGGTPPLTYKNHQGHTMARILEVKGGKYLPISDWIKTD